MLLALSAAGQSPELSEISRVALDHINFYYPEYKYTVESVTVLDKEGEDELFIVQFSKEGWALVSGDKRVIPVIAYSEDGRFTDNISVINPATTQWLSSYKEQIRAIRNEKSSKIHDGWGSAYYSYKSISGDAVNVDPFIEAEWNQGAGWNRFCPEDSLGPGGHAYVGCVAVAMAQAMSVYAIPDTGVGSVIYYHNPYGNLTANFSEANYKWDSMAYDRADDYNALLLYHCALSVYMKFGPDGSSAKTSSASTAMGKYFRMSNNMNYWTRRNHEDEWSETLRQNLLAGRPIIYRGNGSDDESGHAFNIDGVQNDDYFHLNWGWGGSMNGYYLIDNLKPSGHDYTESHAAVLDIQPFYWPTGIELTDTIVPVNLPEGSFIAKALAIDEADDNEYIISMKCDSSFIDNEWVADYIFLNDSLFTGHVFTDDDKGADTLSFSLVDKYGNEAFSDIILAVTDTISSTAIDDIHSLSTLIYPNPASEHVSIRTDSDIPATYIRTYSSTGELIRETKPSGNLTRLNTGDLIPGLYIIEIEFGDGLVLRKKLIKGS